MQLTLITCVNTSSMYTDDYCKLCDCSGNINPEDPASCDSVTGECTKCLNNTAGESCQLCAPGYFGDAISLKDCQSKCIIYIYHNSRNQIIINLNLHLNEVFTSIFILL